MWNKRGRPKIKKSRFDKGTKELRQKKALEITTHPLDYCLKHKIITYKQYLSGMKLRWLYTLKYGSPTIQSKQLTEVFFTPKEYDQKWLMEKQKLYHETTSELNKVKLASIIADVCIFLVFPKGFFLDNYKTKDRFFKGIEMLEKYIH